MPNPTSDEAEVQAAADHVSRIYAALRQRLIRRAPDDEFLSESELVREFGVSRTPVREALALLRHDGIVERARTGYRLRRFSPDALMNLHEARVTLEVSLAGLAAERCTPLEMARLEHIHALLAAPIDAELADDYRTRFHQTLWVAAHNPEMVGLLERAFFQLRVIDHQQARAPEELDEAIDDHSEIIEALRSRAPEAARQAMARHLESTGRRLLAQLATNQGGF